jgi:hypothetical protein
MAAPNLSRVLSGRFRSVTVDALWRMLRGMGVDVQITAALAATPPAITTPATATAAQVKPTRATEELRPDLRVRRASGKRAPAERG